jgi:endonuclease/exonuclease/phosphatase (EEP) superfamily protein YafD
VTRRGRLLSACWVLFAVLMLVTVTPARWGWTGWPIVLSLVSFPLAVGLVTGAVALAFGVGTMSRRSQDRRVRVAVALLLAAVAVFQVTTVVRRGGWWAEPVTRQSGDVVVVAFNSAGQEPLPGEVLDIIRRERPQVVALPETRPKIAAELAVQAGDAGLDYQEFSQRVQTRVSVTSLLVAGSLGTYVQDQEGSDRAAAVRVVPVNGDEPVVVGVHPESPDLFGRNAAAWQEAGRTAVAQCSDTQGAIVAGDFNATIDHPQLSELGPCRDAATQAGQAEGTWPTVLPAAMAAAIDHVLFDGRRWRSVDVRTIRVGHSDHRLVIATLRER